MYLGFILWAIILVIIVWNTNPALVIISALIGVMFAIAKTKDNKPQE
jgi:hypothetical protein